MADESLSLAALAEEFEISYRTLRRDLRERLAYLDIGCQNGIYRLHPDTLKAYRDKDVLTFVRQTEMTRIFRGWTAVCSGWVISVHYALCLLIWKRNVRILGSFN